MKHILLLTALACVAPGPARAAASPASERAPALSLAEALRRTSASNPAVLAAREQAEAAGARRMDAGRLANPALSASIENAGGTLGRGRVERSAGISQLFELGGDRAARAGHARAGESVAQATAESVDRDEQTRTIHLFLEAWAAQERAARFAAAVALARNAVEAAANRLRAGAAPVFERTRAEGLLVQREIDRERAETERTLARRALARQWSADDASPDSLALATPGNVGPEAFETLVGSLGDHPEARAARAAVTQQEWTVRGARAARVPDVTVEASVKRLEEADGTGFGAAVSIPLPIWSASRGEVLAAEAEQRAAELHAAAVARRLELQLRDALAREATASKTWRRVGQELLPAARQALSEIEAAYRMGRLTYVDIQEGQRSAIDAELAHIDAMADLWRARMAIGLLTGGNAPRSEESAP